VLLKAEGIVEDLFDDELILMALESRQMIVLNEGGRIVWEALDQIRNPADLIEMATRALPEFDHGEVERAIGSVIGQLIERGFLVMSAPDAD